MSPGPTTIRKVSRLRAHLDFTTRPRTGITSISRPAAGSITNLLLIDASPFHARENTAGITAGKAIATPPTGTNTYWRLSKGKNSSSRNWSVGLQPSAFTTVISVEEAAAKTIA